MIRINTTLRVIGIAVSLLGAASAQTWTAPTALSTGGQGFEAAAAMDGNGNSVALWDEITTSQSQLWSKSRPSGGNWGAATDVSLALQTTSVFPAVRISTAGFATAVWTDENGVWTADRPAASSWKPAVLLIPGASNPIFVMNSQGAAAIAWTTGGPPGSGSAVMAMLRPAGGSWSAQQTVASGQYVLADHAGIAGNGAVIVTYEAYEAICKKYGCSRINYVLHASRQNPGGGVWADSGALLGPDAETHDGRAAIDAAGGAILVAVNSAGAYASATQGNSGGAWSAWKTIVNPQAITITTDLQSDDAGQVTLVYEFIGFSASQVFAANGSISNNTWSSPVVISGSDTSVGQVYLAISPGGAGLAIWLSSSGTPVVHAVLRTTATGTWSSPAGVSGAGSEISPEAAAVNSAGNAIVIYSGYDANNEHIEYATNH